MRKTLSKKTDPLLQIRLEDPDYIKLIEIAEEETRTLPNLVKHAVLTYIRMDTIASQCGSATNFNKWYKALRELDY